MGRRSPRARVPGSTSASRSLILDGSVVPGHGRDAEADEAAREVNRSLTARLEPEKLLQTITEHAVAIFQAETGQVFLYRSEHGVLELTVSVDRTTPASGALGRVGETLASRVWDSMGVQAVDAHGTFYAATAPNGTLGCRSALAAPIRWADQFLGVLGVLGIPPDTPGSTDGAVLEVLAEQAAVAIVNARLYTAVQRLAVIDPVTGVLNRRGLLALGPREVERAHRYHRPLAMLFVDIDDFKVVNDRFSHSVGDQMLREVGARLSGNVREMDVVARWGGDEFAVLLVETGLAAAREVAERVRRAVEATSLATRRGTTRVTVSIGIATLRGMGMDLEALTARADEAMYAAKGAGRNRVEARTAAPS
jgi:diguanylate cyclase (GGDEF)-like protein